MGTEQKFNFWSRRGWFRLWGVAAVCWAFSYALYATFYVYAASPILSPPLREILSKPLFGEDAAARAVASSKKQFNDICLDGTIDVSVYSDPIPPASAIENEKSAKDWLGIDEELSTNGKISAGAYWNRISCREYGSCRNYLSDKRKKRIKNKDFHTHNLYVQCSKKSEVRYDIARVLAAMFLPPLGILAAVAGLILLIPWLLKFVRWITDGFRIASDGVASGDNVPADAMNADVSSIAATRLRPKTRVRAGLGVVGAIVAVGLAAIFANGLSSITNRFLSGLRDGASVDILVKTEAAVRSQLPIKVGPDVMAVDLEIEKKGLRWTYQITSTEVVASEANVAKFMDEIKMNACKSQAIKSIIEQSFHVKYGLVDATGRPLAEITIAKCD